MSFFKRINSVFKSVAVDTDAVKIIAARLQNKRIAKLLGDDPMRLATEFVSITRKDNRDLLYSDSNPYLIPNPLILAAFSMAHGIKICTSDFQWIATAASFISLFAEILETLNESDLNDMDKEIFEITIQVANVLTKEVQDNETYLQMKKDSALWDLYLGNAD